MKKAIFLVIALSLLPFTKSHGMQRPTGQSFKENALYYLNQMVDRYISMDEIERDPEGFIESLFTVVPEDAYRRNVLQSYLNTAIRKNKPKLISLFVTYGADINVQTIINYMSYYYFWGDDELDRNKVMEFTSFLLNHVPINSKTSDGSTLLITSVIKYPLFTGLLLAKGADINQQDKFGKTALMWAAQKDNIKLVEILLNAGADSTIKDNVGNRAYDWATGKSKKLLIKETKIEEPIQELEELETSHKGKEPSL